MAVGRYKVLRVDLDGLEEQLNWLFENSYIVEGMFWIEGFETEDVVVKPHWRVIARQYIQDNLRAPSA